MGFGGHEVIDQDLQRKNLVEAILMADGYNSCQRPNMPKVFGQLAQRKNVIGRERAGISFFVKRDEARNPTAAACVFHLNRAATFRPAARMEWWVLREGVLVKDSQETVGDFLERTRGKAYLDLARPAAR